MDGEENLAREPLSWRELRKSLPARGQAGKGEES